MKYPEDPSVVFFGVGEESIEGLLERAGLERDALLIDFGCGLEESLQVILDTKNLTDKEKYFLVFGAGYCTGSKDAYGSMVRAN